MSLTCPSLQRLSVLLLSLSLLTGGCGWFFGSNAAPPGGPTLSTSEAAREAELSGRPTPTPPQPAAAPAPPPPSRRDAPDVLDRVIVVVNNDVITLSELQDSLAFYLYETKETVKPGDEEALKQRLLNRMIEGRLQLQEANREHITVEDSEVDEQLVEVMKRVNAKTQEEFEQVIKAQGLTLEGVKKRTKDQILIQKVIRRKVAFRISVTEQEIDQYLVENREKLETGLTYHARHILFVPTPPESEAAWDAARGRAEAVWARVRAGEDFVELAKRHSEDSSGKDGGDLGVLKQGELTPEVEHQILRLRPGDTSAPFRSRLGFHIFKLEWKEGLAGEALAQAKQQIRDILIQQKYAARLAAWIAEIRKRAILDIRM